MNWKKFELKYDKRETWAFEQMAYLLFCSEFNNRIGIFRYKNQAGIETNPIEHDGKLIGFQAKYYTNSISESKDDIIDSIRKAKSKNPKLTDVFFYVNQELSESSKKNEKAPKYQKEIEKVSSGEGIKLHWRVPSHFELQLALPENQYINELFFSIDSSVGDLIDEIYKHNKKILSAIRTEILFHDKVFKIDRSVLSDEEINFANVWGVADDDVYRRAMKENDNSYKDGKPFFNMIMTADMAEAKISLKDLQKILGDKGEALGLEIRAQHADIFQIMHRI